MPKEVIDENHRQYPVETWGHDYRTKPAYWEWFYNRKKIGIDRETARVAQPLHSPVLKTGW